MLITVQPKVGCGCPLLPGAKEDAGQQGGGWPLDGEKWVEEGDAGDGPCGGKTESGLGEVSLA